MTIPIYHASLFTGIGGFDLAAQWAGWENVFQVEKDKWCRDLLSKRFAAARRYEDIKNFSGHEYYGKIDVISGGFPCQPFSVAGKQQGKSDDRYLWKEMLRVIQEVRPAWVVGENVTGIIKLALDEVLSDLENCGYSTETFIIPACSVNATHRRDRIWVVANDNSGRFKNESKEGREFIQNREWNNASAEQCGRQQQCGVKESVSAHSGSQRTGSKSRETCDKGRESGESRGTSLRQTHGKIGASGINSTSENVINTHRFGELPRPRKVQEQNEEVQKRNNNAEFDNANINNIAAYPDGSYGNTNSNRLQGFGEEYNHEGSVRLPNRENSGWRALEWPTEPPLCGANDGISRRVDRLRGLGNSIVPQVAYEIFSAINLCITSQEGDDTP